MEDKIKNFDRSIEQAMNETSVTPPFGMWNRISAELDAPAPAPTSWGTALLPKAALVGLITLALVETSVMVAFMFNNSTDNKITAQNITHSTITTPTRNIITIPVVKQTEIAALPEKEVKVTLSKKVKLAQVTISKPLDKNSAGVNTQPELKSIAATSEVAVPEQPVKATSSVSNDAYYFPPVDINKSESKVAEKDAAPVTAVNPDDEIETDKKVSLPAEPKIKFKKSKHHNWSYGKLNRAK